MRSEAVQSDLIVEQLEVAIVGAGALGSVLATGMAKLGFRRLLLVDGEDLEPGNLVRHEALSAFVELPKASAVSRLIAPIFDRQRVDALDKDVVLHWSEVRGQLAGMHLVVDCTADFGVHELLGRSEETRQCALAWAYLKPGPRFGMLALRRAGSPATLALAEAQLARNCHRWDEFAEIDESGAVWPEPGCYHPTFRAPYHRVRLMADVFIGFVLDWVRSGMATNVITLFEQRAAKPYGLEVVVACQALFD